jgi:hypothetical protein
MKYIYIVTFLILATSAISQKLIIKFELQGRPLDNILMVMDENPDQYLSDANGLVMINNLNEGPHTVKISGIGIQNQTYNFDFSKDQTFIEIPCTASEAIEMKEIVIVANQWRKKEYISSLDIKIRPIQNAQEILRMVPGLFIGQHAGGGKAEQIFMRGFDIDHGTDIQLTVDGMPVNMVSHAHGQGYADLHFVIPELVENIDFSKGPYLAEKGNFTTAGWVDFKTKNQLDKNIVKGEIGQFETYRIFGGLNLLKSSYSKNLHSAYIASEYNFSNSFFDAPQNFHRLNILSKASGKITPNTSYIASISYFDSKWNHSGQIPERAVADGSISFFGSIDPTEGGSTSRTNINLQSTSFLKNGSFLKNQLYYSQYNFHLFSNFTFFLNDPIFGDQIKQKENRHIIGYNGSFQKEHNFLGKRYTLTLGAQIRQDLTSDTELSTTINRAEIKDNLQLGDINERNIAAYAIESFSLGRYWTVDIGLRFDQFHNQYKNHLSGKNLSIQSATLLPKASLYYNPNGNVQFYFKAGKGFHSNDTRVVVVQKGRNVLPSAYGSDLGLVWKPTNQVIIQPALWYLWLDQEFVYVGDAGVIEPSGKTSRYGFELTTRVQLSKRLHGDFDFNYSHPRGIEEPQGMQYIPLAPIMTSVGGLTYKINSKLSAQFRYRYMGHRPANIDYTVKAKGYQIVDGLVSYQWRDITISGTLNNIFNAKWKETQFHTESRLKEESSSVEEIHFTPGSPFFGKLSVAWEF